MVSFIDSKVKDSLKINMDATTFKIEQDKDGKYVWHIHEAGDKEQVQRHQEHNLCLFIKEMNFTNSYGDVCDSIYIVQDPNLQKDECYHYLVPGLSSAQIAGAAGHLFVMQSRAANAKFNQTVIEKIALPYIDDLRRNETLATDVNSEVDDDDADLEPVAWLFDGEKVQLDGFLDKRLIEFCNTNKIFLIKLAASCTKWQQPLDAGKKFVAKKNNLGPLTNYFENPILTRILNQHLTTHEGIPKHTRTLLISGLQQLCHSDYETLNRQKLTSGYKTIGMVPFDAHKIITNCSTFISAEDQAAIMHNLAHFVKCFKETGHILDSVMDEYLVPKSDIPKLHSKDDKSLIHERCVWVNNDLAYEREQSANDLRIINEDKKQANKIYNEKLDGEYFDMVVNRFNESHESGDWKKFTKAIIKGALNFIKTTDNLILKTSGNLPEVISRLSIQLNVLHAKYRPGPIPSSKLLRNPFPVVSFPIQMTMTHHSSSTMDIETSLRLQTLSSTPHNENTANGFSGSSE
jgi:hypothetical protein